MKNIIEIVAILLVGYTINGKLKIEQELLAASDSIYTGINTTFFGNHKFIISIWLYKENSKSLRKELPIYKASGARSHISIFVKPHNRIYRCVISWK